MENYENLKIAREVANNELLFSKPTDIFIYTRFTDKASSYMTGESLHFADDLSQAINYICYIFMFDILNDISDDLEYDFKHLTQEKQGDILSIMNYWFKFYKISKQQNTENFVKLCNKFNSEYNNRSDIEYQINILNGANSLQKFLIENYSNHINFDRYKLECICSNELFAGKPLQDFVDNLFNT